MSKKAEVCKVTMLLKEARRRLREVAEIAVKDIDLFAHVSNASGTESRTFVTVELYEKNADGRPLTRERQEFIDRCTTETEGGMLPDPIGYEHLGVGIKGPSGLVMGWLVGCDLYDPDLAVIEENDKYRDWVGVPLVEIAARIKEFGVEPAKARIGGPTA